MISSATINVGNLDKLVVDNDLIPSIFVVPHDHGYHVVRNYRCPNDKEFIRLPDSEASFRCQQQGSGIFRVELIDLASGRIAKSMDKNFLVVGP